MASHFVYTPSELRANLRAALGYAEAGATVVIDRYGEKFVLKHVPKESPYIPDFKQEYTAPSANPFIDEVGYVSGKDLENLKIGKGVTVSSTPAGKKNKFVGFANVPSKIELDNKLKSFMAEKKMNFCPVGHSIPDGRSKCMGKGCKYAK